MVGPIRRKREAARTAVSQSPLLAHFPAVVYVWHGENEADLLVEAALPDAVPSGRWIGVYELVDAGELHVTRELKR